MTDRPFARRLRNVVEPIASGVYFAPEATQAYEELGLDYFEGYFTSRSACLGRAPWRVVSAAFAAFKPEAVQAAITTGWAKAEPDAVLAARLRGATSQLERLIGSVASDEDLARATDLLRAGTEGVDGSGRMLFSGLRSLPEPQTPLGRLWRAADLVREHRGDGHIAAWVPWCTSIEVTLLTEPYWGIPPRTYVFTRGWNLAEVDAAVDGLVARGWLTPEGQLTDEGRRVRKQIEIDTDRAAAPVVERLGEHGQELVALLRPWARAIVDGGGYPVDPSALASP